jgi:hypothetical protein
MEVQREVRARQYFDSAIENRLAAMEADEFTAKVLQDFADDRFRRGMRLLNGLAEVGGEPLASPPLPAPKRRMEGA